jgi:hypothetical protein
LGDLGRWQLAEEGGLIFVGVGAWNRASEPWITQIYVIDRGRGRVLRTLELASPWSACRLSTDGTHLYGLIAPAPGESGYKLVLVEAETGRTIRTLAQIDGPVWEFAVRPVNKYREKAEGRAPSAFVQAAP